MGDLDAFLRERAAMLGKPRLTLETGYFLADPKPAAFRPMPPVPRPASAASLTPLQRSLTPADVRALCDAAQREWSHFGRSKKSIRFRWRGRIYKSRWTNFRMLIETTSGEPVACRFG
jgi:hypothetical protein